ncbi:unnamed protein product [Ostreobium quekettii]|uniref:Uncharacterized protein n=1 Tax=Ostreobium quekettii TaxID=121088 RepID=A0A8S1IT06_9CHLO|nr:unnamed protein product [Ostreobium quekettii]
MARASNVVALLAVAGLALIGSTEALLPGLTEGVPEECQPFIENLVSNCTIELLDVATKFEIPFPVPEDFMAPNITEEQVTNYTDTMPPVSEMCCTNMCLTANSVSAEDCALKMLHLRSASGVCVFPGLVLTALTQKRSRKRRDQAGIFHPFWRPLGVA